MKKYTFIILCFLISCGTSKQIFFDENGEEMTSRDFQERWREKDNDLVRWDVTNDTARVATLKNPIYSRYILSYSNFVDKFEEITGKTFPANTTFLIDFTYRDDLCGHDISNYINKQNIASRKEFLKPRLDEIRSRNKEIVFLSFYEIGISLENSPDNPEEFFYKDNGNFLRENLFLTQTLCGSFALIKPNGQTLVRNGESSIWYIEQHLKPENWDQFFPPSE